ncbi:CidA/LrgA family protein [Devosia chinhatensis]|uniref:LrgA n=1 Tax=Devosia chinhatensis TaxID=429727 RepID=A0A0F5FN51_9HYPH|nr:CidA/LrgA family protein [Devosia chinhatensis]KKB10248.1 hypothetical protein VE26_03805 [Devosia chinhatensis]
MAVNADHPLRPADWVTGFAVLILCQLAGEAMVQLLRIVSPGFVFPGPVAGMLLLVLILNRFAERARSTIAVANGLLGILALLFVPSAVGIMQHWAVIQAWGLPLLLAVIGSTVLTLLVTVYAFIVTDRWVERRRR